MSKNQKKLNILLAELDVIHEIASETAKPNNEEEQNPYYLIGWYRQGQKSLLEKIENLLEKYKEQ